MLDNEKQGKPSPVRALWVWVSLASQSDLLASSFWPSSPLSGHVFVSLPPEFEDEIRLSHFDHGLGSHLTQPYGMMRNKFHSAQPVTWSSLFWRYSLGSRKLQSTNSSLCGGIVSHFYFYFSCSTFSLINTGRSKCNIQKLYKGLLSFIISSTKGSSTCLLFFNFHSKMLAKDSLAKTNKTF